MNILVTGANGQLGREMRIISRKSSDSYVFTDVSQTEGLETSFLDITDLDAVRDMVKRQHINAIVNCAAWTDVDAAEAPENYTVVEKLNAIAPENLAIAMKEAGGWLVQISTDYVFGKEPYNTPCTEERKGTPTGVYGATKLLGEQKIMATGCRYLTVRTAWLYSEFGKNFCRTMLNLTSSKPRINVVFDQCGTPTYALDLARAIRTMLERVAGDADAESYCGVYNFSNEGVCSWFDFAKMIQKTVVRHGLEECARCEIRPCHSSEFPSPVVRPPYSVLDKSKIKGTFGIEIPYWTDSLEKCMANLLGTQA